MEGLWGCLSRIEPWIRGHSLRVLFVVTSKDSWREVGSLLVALGLDF